MNKIFKIEGMTCASCVNLIETESKKLTGLDEVNVSFASEKAVLKFQEKNFDPKVFLSLLESLGYRGIDTENEIPQKREGIKSLFTSKLYQSLLLLFFGSFLMFLMFNMNFFSVTHQNLNLFQLISCSFILSFYLKFYFNNIKRFLLNFQSNMHTLIGIGLVTNIIYSYYLFFVSPHSHLYVEGIPFILGFTKLGQYFDMLAKTKAQSTMSSLYKTQIKFSNLLLDGIVSSIPVIELKLGDKIRVKPGEKIPINGKILKGLSHIDESLISGESIPLTKTINDEVLSGSINLEGSLDIEVTSLFHNSTVAQIIKFVELAESKKTSIEKMTDRLVRYFVPFVILIAMITFILWFLLSKNLDKSLIHFIAVLVIACPCALGLAAPICTMITTRRLAELGLLINGGEVIERGALVDTIVFDKTGTLTQGKPVVEKINFFSNLIEKDLAYKYIFNSCILSTHPLSQSIVEKLKTEHVENLDPDKFKNIPGDGFSAEFNENKVYIGKASLLERNGIVVNPALCKDLFGSLVHVGINSEHLCTFVITDQVKPVAKALIANLKAQGIEVWMLTGDLTNIAKNIAEQLEITNVKAEVDPNQKADFILELKKLGKYVAMVGDGINDAVALKNADLSIAMAHGSDVAIASAQVSILDSKINLIPNFIDISKKTVNTIRQNLFLSFIYNVLFIPLAAGAFVYTWNADLDPKWASLAMGFSSFSIIINSLRLKLLKLE